MFSCVKSPEFSLRDEAFECKAVETNLNVPSQHANTLSPLPCIWLVSSHIH